MGEVRERETNEFKCPHLVMVGKKQTIMNILPIGWVRSTEGSCMKVAIRVDTILLVFFGTKCTSTVYALE